MFREWFEAGSRIQLAWENIGVIDYVPNPGGYYTISFNALEDYVEKHTGSIRLNPIQDPETSYTDKVYIRPSGSHDHVVYARVPQGLANGAYLAPVEAEYLGKALIEAANKARQPRPGQSVRITYADGSTEVTPVKSGRGRMTKVEIIR